MKYLLNFTFYHKQIQLFNKFFDPIKSNLFHQNNYNLNWLNTQLIFQFINLILFNIKR